jgi:hypothetical protein
MFSGMSGPAPLPVLDYGAPADDLPAALSLPVRLGLVVPALSAGASAFLPFTYSTSPLDVMVEWVGSTGTTWDGELLLIAAPFFAGVPVAVWGVRRAIRPALRRVERVGMYALALPCVALTAFIAVRALVTAGASAREMAEVTVGPAMIVAGGFLAVWLWRRGWRDAAAVTALHTGYAANGAMLLGAMFSPDHVGWWATLVAVAGMICEGTLACRRASRARRGGV